MKLSANIPDDVWLKIWGLVEPNPVEMGECRGVNRQFQRVMDDDRLWEQYSPRAIADGKTLRNAFMDRVEKRSVKGNDYLASLYCEEIGPCIDYYGKDKKIRFKKLDEPHYDRNFIDYEDIAGYLHKNSNGRDDDFDAACALTAPAKMWKDFSPVICNDPVIVRNAVSKQGGVIAYVGKQLHTPELVIKALMNDGAAIPYVANRYRDDMRYAKCAVASSSYAYLLLNDSLKRTYDIARLHTQSHPTVWLDVYPYIGVDLSLIPHSYLAEIEPSYDRPERLWNDEKFLRELLGVNRNVVAWISFRAWDREEFVQIAWRTLNQRQDQDEINKLRAVVSPRLQARWHEIDTADFLLPKAAPKRAEGWRKKIFKS